MLLMAGGLLAVCALAMLGAAVLLMNQPPSVFDEPGYYVRGNQVYFVNEGSLGLAGLIVQIEQADSGSFEILSDHYARDKARVYVMGQPIPGADPASYALSSGIAKDKSHVYNGAQIISDDPAHFELLEDNMARDSRYGYYLLQRVSDDPANFTPIDSGGVGIFMRDSKFVYFAGKKIAAAEPASFRVLSQTRNAFAIFSRDDQHVFSYDHLIGGADVQTFQPLTGGYARDARQVFFADQRIPDADHATFKVLRADWACAADAHRAYSRGKVIANADPKTFSPNAKVTDCNDNGISFAP